ncbi:hypothetical protein [Acidocella sp.]|uniref:hypothetical protein n=1 Tax=Acidocella sp. TaxID=50710 RepID=UPI002F3F596E
MLSRIFCAAAAFLAISSAAQARPDPAPKPSGVVVHLFGPNSMTAHLLPTAPAHAGGSAAAPATAAAPSSFGAVLHQMFVTGDPNQKPGASLSKGRASRE